MKSPPAITLKPKQVAIIAFLVSLIISSGLLIVFHFSSTKITDPRENHQNRFLTENASNNESERNYINVLLLGSGGAGHSGGTLADTLIVANINYKQRKVVFISLPRDLWVQIPVSSDRIESHKINASYAIGQDDEKYPLKEPMYKMEHGGGNLAIKVVSEIIDMPIDFYVAVDFRGFQEAIDLLGGIDVNVPNTFEDKYYPVKGLEDELCGKSPEEMQRIHALYSGFELEKQFECRYETLHFDVGLNHMDGETALKFVRSRHSAEHGGDFARGERQQALLMALSSRLIKLNAAKDVSGFFSKLSSSVKTNTTTDDILDFIEAYGDPSSYTTDSFGLSTDNVLVNSTSSDGQYILLPRTGQFNWDEVRQYVKNMLN